MNRRGFLEKLGTAFVAGTLAVTAPGLLSASETPDEVLGALEDALKNDMKKNERARVFYIAKGNPTAEGYPSASIMVRHQSNTIKMSDDSDYFQQADGVPDVVEVNGKRLCSGKSCAVYKDMFVTFREKLINEHLENVENMVQKGTYIVPADEGKSYLTDKDGFISILSPDKKFKYKFIDSNGNGSPEEVEIREYQGKKHRLVFHATNDEFTEKHFRGLMPRLYSKMEKHEATKKPSVDYKSKPVPKKDNSLDKALDNALESLKR